MKNLEAEMVCHGVSLTDIQNKLGCSDRTARNKVTGETEFTISEVFKIREGFSRD